MKNLEHVIFRQTALLAHFLLAIIEHKMGQPTSREDSVYETEFQVTIRKWRHVIATTAKSSLTKDRDPSDHGPFSTKFCLPITTRGVKSFKECVAFAYPKLASRPIMDSTG